MAKVSGIDFSNMEEYRETVQVTTPKGLIDLPLIPVRDANIADTYLRRNDVLRSQYFILQERLKQRASACERAQQEIEESGDLEIKANLNTLDTIDGAMEAIKKSQEKLLQLERESHALCDEIHVFIKPYLEGTDVLEMLKKCEDVITINVLQLMTYGAKKEEDEEGGKENPTTPQPQKS